MPVSGYQLVMATPRCILFEPLSNCGLIKMDKNPFTELLDRPSVTRDTEYGALDFVGFELSNDNVADFDIPEISAR